MSPKSNHSQSSHESSETFASVYASERWQGASFAASWIAPPSPSRGFEDPAPSNGGLPHREDDHA